MFTKPKADRLRGRYYFWKSAYVFGTDSGNKLHIINWIPYLMLKRISSSYSVLVITLHWESCYHETHVLYDLYSGTTRRKCICSLQEYPGELIEPYLSQMLLLCNVLSYIMYEKRSKTRIKMYTNPIWAEILSKLWISNFFKTLFLIGSTFILKLISIFILFYGLSYHFKHTAHQKKPIPLYSLIMWWF